MAVSIDSGDRNPEHQCPEHRDRWVHKAANMDTQDRQDENTVPDAAGGMNGVFAVKEPDSW